MTVLRPGRPLVQMVTGLLAVLLRYLGWWEALSVIGLAVAIEAHVVPRVASAAPAAAPPNAGFASLRLFHPLSILCLMLLLPDRVDIVAATWGIVAFGGGSAMIAGRRATGGRVPWNPQRSVAGVVALFAAGALAGAMLAWWCRPAVLPPSYAWFSIGAPVLAALLAAAAVTIPVRLDHNITVAFTSALVLWCASFVSQDLAIGWARASLPLLPVALLATAAVAGAGYALRSVSISGAISGVLIGTVLVLAAGWAAWGLLLLSFALAVVASRIGLRRKTLLGIAEERGGRRGSASAWANTGIAMLAAVLAAVSYAREPALLVFVAALVAGSADTVASEIGKAFGRRTYLVTTLREVPPGQPGGVSLEGTAAGLLGALAIAAVAVALQIIPSSAIVAVVLATLIGSVVESALAATFEAPGVLNSHLLNVLNTTTAAIAVLLL